MGPNRLFSSVQCTMAIPTAVPTAEIIMYQISVPLQLWPPAIDLQHTMLPQLLDLAENSPSK